MEKTVDKMWEWRKENIKQWVSLFETRGVTLDCEICGRKLQLEHTKDASKQVLFDHKRKNNIARGKQWLEIHKPSEKRLQEFLKADFGILCRQCNSFIGSGERRDNIRRYLNG